MAPYLNEDEVAALLDMPSVLEEVMAAHARGEVVDYPRQRVRLGTPLPY
jgi:ornithine cyclodeaminase